MTSNTSEEEDPDFTTTTPLYEIEKDGLHAEQTTLKTSRTTDVPTKQLPDTPEVSKTPRFIQERPSPPIQQRIIKAKEEHQFHKFMEILNHLHINIPLIEAIQKIPNYSNFMKDFTTKRKKSGKVHYVGLNPIV